MDRICLAEDMEKCLVCFGLEFIEWPIKKTPYKTICPIDLAYKMYDFKLSICKLSIAERSLKP